MWYLIENNSSKLLKFSSEMRLLAYAKEKNLTIRRSPLDKHSYYVPPQRLDARAERQQ